MNDPLDFTLMEAFSTAAQKHFGELAKACGSSLQRVLSNVYGFQTRAAIVNVAVYHGHRPMIMAKVRNRSKADYLNVDDSRDIAAGWFLKRDTGHFAKAMPEDGPWTPASIDEAVQQEASILRLHAWGYLTDETADWDGMRKWRNDDDLPPENGSIFKESPLG